MYNFYCLSYHLSCASLHTNNTTHGFIFHSDRVTRAASLLVKQMHVIFNNILLIVLLGLLFIVFDKKNVKLRTQTFNYVGICIIYMLSTCLSPLKFFLLFDNFEKLFTS